MIKPNRLHIEHIIVFVLVFGATAYAFPEFLGIEITESLWLFFALQGLIVTGFFFVFRKKHAKGGHVPLVVGLYLLILGGGMLVGSVEHQQTNQFGEETNIVKLWELSQRNAGVFAVIVIVGIVSIGIGIRIAIQNAYFWTWKAWLVILVTVGMIALLAFSFLNL